MFVNWYNFQTVLYDLHNWKPQSIHLVLLYDYMTTFQFCLEKAVSPWYASIYRNN